MTAPTEGIKDLLVTAGVGTFNSPPSGTWPIYISKMPDEPAAPDSVIALFDTGGLNPNPKWLLDYPDVVIMVRAQSYSDAQQKIQDCRSVTLGLTSQTINGDRWDSVTAIGGFVFTGRDEKDRCIFTQTLRLIVEPAASSLDIRQPL